MPCSSNSSIGTSSTSHSNSNGHGNGNGNGIPMHGQGKENNHSTKTPRINNTRSTSNASASSTLSKAQIHGVPVPGIFRLMDQNNWKRVAERARKYRKECRVTAHVKRYQHFNQDDDGNANGMGNDGNGQGQGQMYNHARDNSCSTFDTNYTTSTQQTSSVSNVSSFNPKTHVKCKALHHACHRLRRVHGHIRKRVSESLRHEHFCALHNSMNGNGNMNINVNVNVNAPAMTPTESLSFNSISSFDSSVSEDGYNLHSHSHTSHGINGSAPSLFDPFGFNSKHKPKKEIEEWDDPWIEACKAILAILEQNPEAAGQRESRHGCLPIHLAVFAMCPTPDVQSVEKLSGLNVDVNTCNSNISRNNNNSGNVTGMNMNRNSVMNKQTFSIAEEMPPPRPLMRSRRLSNSSASSSVGTQSLDGFSAAMEREVPLGSGNADGSNLSGASASSPNTKDRELTLTLERLEAQLRLSPDSKLSNKDEADMLQSARILCSESPKTIGKGIARPSPLGSRSVSGSRSISVGSQTSTCSNSVMTSASSIYSHVPSPRVKPLFNLKKYIADEARREEYSLRVLNALLDAYPRGVKVDSEGGRLPLHTAVAGKATLKVVETLVRAYPHACRHRNNENSLPIHIAACYGVSESSVAPMLLKFYPDGSLGKNRWGRTPYQEAVLTAGLNGRPYQEELCRALGRSPDFWSGTGEYGQSQQKGGYLNTNNARGLEDLMKGEFQNSRRSHGPYDIDADYIDVNDLFALIKERQWKTIVDNIDVLQSQANKRVKSEVRAGYPAEVSALYLACEQEPTYEVLDALVNACPTSTIWRKQPGGELPIHAACTWGGSRAVIGFLLAASPESSRQRDNHGNLALHSACFSGTSQSIVESLLCTNPKAANARNLQGSTPRDIVSRLSHPNRKEIMSFIENVSLELMKKKRQFDNQKQIQQRQVEREILGRRESKEVTRIDVDEDRTTRKVKKPLFRLSRKKSKDSKEAKESEVIQEPPQAPMNERITTDITPPPEETIEIELTDETNDVLWI